MLALVGVGGVEAWESLVLLRLKGFRKSSFIAADRDFKERESERWCCVEENTCSSKEVVGSV